MGDAGAGAGAGAGAKAGKCVTDCTAAVIGAGASCPTIVGINHGFSFPLRFFEALQLAGWACCAEWHRRHGRVGVVKAGVRPGC